VVSSSGWVRVSFLRLPLSFPFLQNRLQAEHVLPACLTRPGSPKLALDRGRRAAARWWRNKPDSNSVGMIKVKFGGQVEGNDGDSGAERERESG